MTRRIEDSVGSDSGGAERVPVGHACQVLSLILMQAGVLPLSFIDAVLKLIPVGGGCCPSEERDEYHLAFNQALEEYKKRNTPHDLGFYPVVLKATGDESAPVRVKIRADGHITACAVKYQPADWHTVMTCGDKTATVTYNEFTRPAPEKRVMVGQLEGAEAECVVAKSKAHRARGNAIYLMHPDKENAEVQKHELVGRRVRLVGLKRAELNGSFGTARAYNPFANRLAVELDNRPGERMAVKSENLDMVDSETE